MKHGLLLVPSEAPAVVEYDDLRDLRKLIHNGDGFENMLVERVRVGEGWSLAVNEEGRFVAEPTVNPVASMLYGTLAHGQWVVGTAVLCKEGYVSGGFDWVDTTVEEILHHLVLITAGRMAEVGLRGVIPRMT